MSIVAHAHPFVVGVDTHARNRVYAILAGTMATRGFPVAEAPGMVAKKRRGMGKSDPLDAHQIAMALLLLRGNDLGIDARQKLTGAQINEVSKWRSREEELALSIALLRPYDWRNTPWRRINNSQPTRTSGTSW